MTIKNSGLTRLRAAARKVGLKCLGTEKRGAQVRLRCAHGHEFMRTRNYVLVNEGIVCPECRDNARLARIQAVAQKRGGQCLETHYLGRNARYRFVCAEGHQWQAPPPRVLARQGNWCKRCVAVKQSARQRAPDGLRRLQMMARAKGGECLSLVYTGVAAHYHLRCAKGHEWQAFGSSIVAGSWCMKCVHEDSRDSIETMQAIAHARGGRCLSTTYFNNRRNLAWECHRGHVWQAAPYPIKKGHWCPVCAKMNNITSPNSKAWMKYTTSSAPTMTTKPMNPISKRQHDPLALRKSLGLNQSDFWGALGITQSGGSFYEKGRKLPKPVAMLLELVYVKKFSPQQVGVDGIRVLRYLKQDKPDLYATLTKAVRSASA